MQHMVSVRDVPGKQWLERLFRLTDRYRQPSLLDRLVFGLRPPLRRLIVATLFYEPSTRTRLSFETAALRLGGGVISTESAGQFSSAAKGETIEDSTRVVSGYADVIVIRHHEKGIASRAAAVASVPIINAGDGNGEHPTQALLDAYTIWQELGRLDALRVGMVGDLLNGRTIHSLIRLLALYSGNIIRLVSPRQLRLPEELVAQHASAFSKMTEHESLETVLPEVDVLYVTRVQKERFDSTDEYEQLKNCYRVDAGSLRRMKPDAIIMHPLPRVTEIAREVDDDPRAAYFRQAENGLYVRMALLTMILSK